MADPQDPTAPAEAPTARGDEPAAPVPTALSHRRKKPAMPLTEELLQRVEQSLSAGNYLEIAMQRNDITPRHHYRWLRYAKMPRKPQIYRDYAKMVARAEAIAEERLVFIVSEATERSPNLALEMLSRRFPKRWSLRVKQAIDEERDELLARLERNLTPQEFDRALEAVIFDPRGGAIDGPPGRSALPGPAAALPAEVPAQAPPAAATPAGSEAGAQPGGAPGSPGPEPGVPGSEPDPA